MKLVNRILVIVSMFCLSMSLQARAADTPRSGLNVGDDAPAFDPKHISGPDRGTTTCPMCKYGDGQGVMIWLNTDELGEASEMANRLEREIQDKGLDRIRVFMMYMNPRRLSDKEVNKVLGDFASQFKNVAVTYLPSPTDPETAGLYKINPDREVQNTVLVYRKRTIVEKFVNIDGSEKAMDRVVNAIVTVKPK